MVKGTYILLDRGILEHWLYSDKPFNKSMAWIDMLLIASHTTKERIWRGQLTEFKRGDVNLSFSALAKRWGWSRDKVRRFIKALECDGMVTVNATTNKTTITIVKYDDFQLRRTTNKATNKTTDNTTDKATDKAQLINVKECNKQSKLNTVAPLPDDEEDSEWDEDDWIDPKDVLEGRIKLDDL